MNLTNYFNTPIQEKQEPEFIMILYLNQSADGLAQKVLENVITKALMTSVFL